LNRVVKCFNVHSKWLKHDHRVADLGPLKRLQV
jgi:hypothetical protein